MNILQAFSIIIIFFSFLAFGTLSLWNELHQSIFAIAGALLFCISTKNHNSTNLTTPVIILFSIIFFSALLFLIDYKSGKYISPLLISALYLNTSIMLQLGIQKAEKKVFLEFISLCATLTACMSFIIQVYQSKGWSGEFYPWMYSFNPSLEGRPYANIGQPNILASIYITFLALLLWANKEGLLRLRFLFFFGAFIAYGIALTQSRSAYLSLAVISIVMFLQKSGGHWQKTFFPFILLFTTASTHLVQISTGMSRNLTEDLNNNRFSIWLMAIDAIKESPWTGFGIHETARSSIAVIEKSQITNGLAAQSHNLFLDIFIWLGVPIGIIISSLILYVIFKIFYSCIKRDYFYPVAALSPLFIHSNLEYPLYYANNLVLFSLVLGLTAVFLPESVSFSIKPRISKLSPKIYNLVLGMTTSFGIFFAYELLSIEAKTIDQKRYFSFGHIEYKQNFEKFYVADIPRDYARLLSIREDSEWSEETIAIAENLSMYFSSSRYYDAIIGWHLSEKNNDNYQYWRSKAINILGKESAKKIAEKYPLEKI